MTDNEKKKEFLKSYRNLYDKVLSLQEQKKSIIETMVSARSQNYDSMPKAKRIVDLSDYVIKLENVMISIDDTNAHCIARKVLIETAIINMQNGIESTVLHKRYVLFKTWEVIAIETRYCVKQVQRIHGKALLHFIMPERSKNDGNCCRF